MAGIAIGFMFLPQLIGLVVPNVELLPQSILMWSIATAMGEPAGFLTR